VPGVLLSNRPLKDENANLRDIPVSVLNYFGIKAPSQMNGRAVF
jgi:bisphosphoglycerate-independent phosphoglycerate mutase (AlkP superfamily)